MILRSGTIKNNKCKKCNEFHAYKKFKHLCSNCFQKKFPILAKKKINSIRYGIPCWDKTTINLLLKKYTVPSEHAYWKALKHMFQTNSIFQKSPVDEINTNYMNFLDTMKRSKFIHIKGRGSDVLYTVNIRGITAEQGKILTDIVRKNFPDDSLRKHWKAQHAICGLIIDYWNITAEKHGGVGYCYYCTKSYLPKITVPWKDFSIPPAFMKPFNKDNKQRINFYRRRC